MLIIINYGQRWQLEKFYHSTTPVFFNVVDGSTKENKMATPLAFKTSQKNKIKLPILTLNIHTESTNQPKKTIKKSEKPCPIHLLWKKKHISLHDYITAYKYLELIRYARSITGTPALKTSGLSLQRSPNSWVQRKLAQQHEQIYSYKENDTLLKANAIEKELNTLPNTLHNYFNALVNNTPKQHYAQHMSLYAKALRLAIRIIKQYI